MSQEQGDRAKSFTPQPKTHADRCTAELFLSDIVRDFFCECPSTNRVSQFWLRLKKGSISTLLTNSSDIETEQA